MSAETTRAIEAAIKAHIKATNESGDGAHEHLLSNWIVAFDTSGISDGDDGALFPCWGQDYTTGETSSPVISLGLSVWLAQTIKNQLAPVYEEDEDEDA